VCQDCVSLRAADGVKCHCVLEPRLEDAGRSGSIAPHICNFQNVCIAYCFEHGLYSFMRFLTTFLTLTVIGIDALGVCNVGTPPRAVSRYRRHCDVKKISAT
jgi:hypothetical protein